MPNHIKNKIELLSDEQEVKLFVEKFSTFFPAKESLSHDGNHIYKNESGEYGWFDTNTTVFFRRNMDAVLGIPDGFNPEFENEFTRMPDFEKVFPVPESIKAVGNSVNSSVVDCVYKKYNKPFSSNPLLGSLESMNREKVKLKPEDQMQFELACKAYEETGFSYWYDYNQYHWGTKWNAYSCEKISDNIFTFETAWNGVPNIIKEMSKSFKGTIIYKFSDEDTGYNVGSFKIASGVVLDSDRPEGGSRQAYDLAFELRPEYKENYELINGKWQYK